jgi:uncharacterized protein involved in type VI secretion and phage assembly
MLREAVFDRPPAWLHAGYLARVVSIDDPERLNRVQVRLVAYDGIDGQDAPLWARVVAPFAGNDRGTFFMPDVDDEVVVLFTNGDARFPLVIGGVWNGASPAPADLGPGGNRYKRIRSKNGITITLDDQQGQETLTMETPGGQTLTLADGPGTITCRDSNGNSVTMESAGVTIQSASTVKVQASTVEVSAGMVTVDAAMAKFSGVVKCEVSTSYTPGAGNIW